MNWQQELLNQSMAQTAQKAKTPSKVRWLVRSTHDLQVATFKTKERKKKTSPSSRQPTPLPPTRRFPSFPTRDVPKNPLLPFLSLSPSLSLFLSPYPCRTLSVPVCASLTYIVSLITRQGAGKGGKKVPAPAAVVTKKGTVKLSAAAALQQLHAANLPSADLLEELAARFVLNCPEEELDSFERILFLVEQAHWYYEDFVREEQRNLKGMKLREFAELMFNKCSTLKRYKGKVDEIYKKFTNYKFSVPVGGLIILNPTLDKCVMVKGYKSGSSWGFPKGKINKDEPEVECAAREVLEEVGVDFSGLVREEDSIVVHRVVDHETGLKQRSRLFIVPGVSEQTHFATQTRKEISQIAWHPLTMLAKEEGKKYFFVKPFVQPLLKWIKQYKKSAATAGDRDGQGGRHPQHRQPQTGDPPGGAGAPLSGTLAPLVSLPPPSAGSRSSGAPFAPAAVYAPKTGALPAQRFPALADFAFDRRRVLAHFA